MEINKRKYKKEEVKELLNKIVSEYEVVIKEQKERISQLNSENKRLLDNIEELKGNEQKTILVLKSAEEKGEEIKSNAQKYFEAELLAIKNFDLKWKEYFAYLLEKYPYYNSINNANQIREELTRILNTNELRKNMPIIEEKTKTQSTKGKKTVFNPKQKIQDYISANSENGFNLDEVLNPGKLELEDLCKELGLIDEQ